MAKRNMVDELVKAFLALNPDRPESFARGVVGTIERGAWAAVLADWKGQARLRAQGRKDLPLPVDQPANSSGMATERPAKPIREVKKPYTLLLPPSMLEALAERANADGSSVSHHIRVAIAAYLKGSKR